MGVATSAIEAGRYELAEETLEQALRAAPSSVEPLFWRAMLEARRRDLPAALDWFDRTLAREPNYGRAHLERGKVLRGLEQHTESVRALGRACELLPRSFEAHYLLAYLLLEAGSEDAALPYLLRAYEHAADSPLLTPLHDKLAELVEGDPGLGYQLALVCEHRGDWLRALDWIERVLLALQDSETGAETRTARLGDAHHRRARYLQQLEREEEAVGAYKRALELAPEHFWALHDLGLLLTRMPGRTVEAAPFCSAPWKRSRPCASPTRPSSRPCAATWRGTWPSPAARAAHRRRRSRRRTSRRASPKSSRGFERGGVDAAEPVLCDREARRRPVWSLRRLDGAKCRLGEQIRRRSRRLVTTSG